ncbi:hypothetical protein GCM10009676_44420 [Prauserella halophila]|uniref:Uncharacterized protein n=1 Tax=Prauserella halophila TaxID=185641 RepID=A0ABN1WNG4_9PSEU
MPTPTRTLGWSGRGRRTIRLTAIDAACAPTIPAAAVIQSFRRCLSAPAPTSANANHPALCSPKWDMPRAIFTVVGLTIRS